MSASPVQKECVACESPAPVRTMVGAVEQEEEHRFHLTLIKIMLSC